jgi:hypothetical protein
MMKMIMMMMIVVVMMMMMMMIVVVMMMMMCNVSHIVQPYLSYMLSLHFTVIQG